jgi:2-(1,2-epoxy-1,2-dihydrophenyl)acetyl-CoA isomerase
MSDLVLSKEAGVAVLTLNRPTAKNAINATLALEFGQVIETLRRDPDVRVLVITGPGDAFCAGGDVREVSQGGAKTAERRYAGLDVFSRIAVALHALDKPVIAAVHGVAYGAGFSLALLADIVLASEDARCMVFHRIGLIPDVGAFYTLPRVVGLQRAKELIFSAREIDAREAHAYSIALEVLPSDGLLPRAMELAQALASSSPTAFNLSKRALPQSLGVGFNDVMQAWGQPIAIASEFANESVRRFVNKEPPQFSWPAERRRKAP